MPRAVADGADREHHRYLDQHPDHAGQRRPRLRAEDGNRYRHRQFEEVARADEGAGGGDAVGELDPLHQPVGEG